MNIGHISNGDLMIIVVLRYVLAAITTLTVFPTQAQTASTSSQLPEAEIGNQIKNAKGGSSVSERAIEKAELMSHMDEVWRRYPALYDKLRRGPKASAPESSVPDSPDLTPVATQEFRSIETLLRQEIKGKGRP